MALILVFTLAILFSGLGFAENPCAFDTDCNVAEPIIGSECRNVAGNPMQQKIYKLVKTNDGCVEGKCKYTTAWQQETTRQVDCCWIWRRAFRQSGSKPVFRTED